jgi:hypothetical protein
VHDFAIENFLIQLNDALTPGTQQFFQTLIEPPEHTPSSSEMAMWNNMTWDDNTGEGLIWNDFTITTPELQPLRSTPNVIQLFSDLSAGAGLPLREIEIPNAVDSVVPYDAIFLIKH